MTYREVEQLLLDDGYIIIDNCPEIITTNRQLLCTADIDGIIQESIRWQCGNSDDVINNTYIAILDNNESIRGIYHPIPNNEEIEYIMTICEDYKKEMGGY